MKFLFFFIVLATTFYVATIFINKSSALNAEQMNLIIRTILPVLISTISLGAVGYLLTKGKRNKFLVIAFLVALGASIFFIRSLITVFSETILPQGIGLSLVYMAIGAVSSIVIGINTFSPKIKPPIDTVTIEPIEESAIKFSQRTRFIIGIGFFILTAVLVSATKQAFVKAPIFGLFDALYSEAFISGVVGGILETAFFFSVIQPVIHSFVYERFGNAFLALIVGIVGVTALFLLFHTTVYKYDTKALNTVLIFGFANALNVFIFRDNTINMGWHFSNNFFTVLFRLTVFGVV